MATVSSSGDIRKDNENNNTIALFAHGKLIQEDMLADYLDAQTYTQYVIGDIEADFLDSDDYPDIVTSDRQRVNQDDPRFKALKKLIKDKVLSEISKVWTGWRNELKAKASLSIPWIKTWYDDLPKTGRETAAKLLGKIDGYETSDLDEKESIQKSFINQFPEIKNTQGIKNIATDELIKKIKVINKDKGIASSTLDADKSKPELATIIEKDLKKVKQSQESTRIFFEQIKNKINNSKIEEDLKEIGLYDLDQARRSYDAGLYKACIVMLGSVLEGVLLGILRRDDVIYKIKNDKTIEIEKILRRVCSIEDPSLREKMCKLNFEECKAIIGHLISDIEKYRVDEIQELRNFIHPKLAILTSKSKSKSKPNETRTINLTTSLDIFLDHILKWNP